VKFNGESIVYHRASPLFSGRKQKVAHTKEARKQTCFMLGCFPAPTGEVLRQQKPSIQPPQSHPVPAPGDSTGEVSKAKPETAEHKPFMVPPRGSHLVARDRGQLTRSHLGRQRYRRTGVGRRQGRVRNATFSQSQYRVPTELTQPHFRKNDLDPV